MRLLQGDLPSTVTVDGVDYGIYTDFRRWILLESILFEEEGSFLEKLPKLLTLCYRKLPPTLEDAVGFMIEFYSGGKKTSGERRNKTQPTYSFVQDEDLIYAAFYQQYGIDLLTADLHWWQFCALLSGLSEQTRFLKIVGYRGLDLSAVKNPEAKRFYRQMKALHKLTDTRTEAQKEAEFSNVLSKIF